MDKEEIQKIRKFTTKFEIDKAFRTLEGILKGIAIDNKITEKEIHELKQWCGAHFDLIDYHPFNEAIPTIMQFVEDNVLDEEEYQDLIWLTESVIGKSIYYDAITGDLQVLQGIIHGILADNIIEEKEIVALQSWMSNNIHLKGCFPYDELYALIGKVLEDNKLSNDEIKLLKAFFADFIPKVDTTINVSELEQLKNEMKLSGICARNPDINIKDNMFCFTGASEKAKKADIEKIIIKKGGRYHESIIKKLNFLVVGNAGNPCWAFTCYGRKIEQAIEMRKEGLSIQIVNENDFWKVV